MKTDRIIYKKQYMKQAGEEEVFAYNGMQYIRMDA